MTLKHHPLKCFSHNSALIALLCLGSLFLNIEVLHGNPVPEFSSAFSLAKGIDVDLTRKKVRIPITLINEDASGLEFIVTIGTEKDYESLFSTSIRAKELHMALLMAELTPSENLMLAPSPRLKIG